MFRLFNFNFCVDFIVNLLVCYHKVMIEFSDFIYVDFIIRYLIVHVTLCFIFDCLQFIILQICMCMYVLDKLILVLL